MLSKVSHPQLLTDFSHSSSGHPYEPTMAVSGIDHTIKIFSPDARDQRNARKGIGVQFADPQAFSSLSFGRSRRAQSTAESPARDENDSEPDSDDEVAPNGLRSRKRMHQAYQITSQNDMDRKGGPEDYFISVSGLLMCESECLLMFFFFAASCFCAVGETYCSAAGWWRGRRG